MSTIGKEVLSEEHLHFEEIPDSNEPQSVSIKLSEDNPMIIKNGNMTFRTEQLEQAKLKVDSLLIYYKGYYGFEKYNARAYQNTYELTIRIPSISFDSLIYDLENGIGQLESNYFSARDVTEEYLDLKMRLKNKQAYLDQYRALLLKSKSIKDVLEVQEKIRLLEEEIESSLGRINYLENQVQLATLQLELYQRVSSKEGDSEGFFTRIKNAFSNGIQMFLSAIVGLIYVWPFLLLFLLLFWVRKPLINNFRKK
ncbi:MAG: DUF4349 domain-containing protein [Saprospiraceae bacterium]|nr:DUF4349 domain-containing protein [Saprospiraceae bacterium]